MKAIILDTYRGIRRLDQTKSYPNSLVDLPDQTRVLDRILASLRAVGVTDIIYVGGYHIQKAIQNFPELRFYFHAEWDRKGELAALLAAHSELNEPCLLHRACTIVLPEAISKVLAAGGDIVVTRGHLNESNYLPDSGGDGTVLGIRARPPVCEDSLNHPSASRHEDCSRSNKKRKQNVFCGVAYLSQQGVRQVADRLAETVAQDPHADLSGFFEILESSGCPIQTVDLAEAWAYVQDRMTVAKLMFGTKAQTLSRLQPLVRKCIILEQVCFTISQWQANPKAILEELVSRFGAATVVVRSSALCEDGWQESAAGKFRSILNVAGANEQALAQSIQTVMESFGQDGTMEDHQILVQPQLEDVRMSGVLFTRDLDTGAPYYIVNYDRITRQTNTVTAGDSGHIETTIISRYCQSRHDNPIMNRLIAVAGELEELTSWDALDIEFAVDHSDRIYLFQVRPLTTLRDPDRVADEDVKEQIELVRDFYTVLTSPQPHLAGRYTILGTMPDWNPAEIIGTSPRPLALSLYQKLVGDSVWGEARRVLGYRDTFPEPLIVSLAGVPYVDVRASLNSFLPGGLPRSIAEKLVNHQLDVLTHNPTLHDKIEFEVAITCLAFDFTDRRTSLINAGLPFEEIEIFRKALLALTDNMLRQKAVSIRTLMADLQTMSKRCEAILYSQGDSPTHLARKIRQILADCSRFGTMPFAILARYAFVAITMLKSLNKVGILSDSEYEAVLGGMPTVATDISNDMTRLAAGEISESQFLSIYGHLRPGTYDLLSPTYEQAIHRYCSGNGNAKAKSKRCHTQDHAESILQSKSDKMGDLLHACGFQCSSQELVHFIAESIPARELSKFEFSKSVSRALELAAAFGNSLGFSRNDISYCSIDRIISFATNAFSGADPSTLMRDINLSRKQYYLTRAIRLPELICRADEIDCFDQMEWLPTFVTSKRVTGAVFDLDHRRDFELLPGSVVLVRSADPGFDWLFQYPISGLVTQYGGAASHMAIRAAEFGLPAAIGCGEVLCQKFRRASVMELDCANRQIRVVE